MPTLEALASEGLRFNRFHTTALCSPTRTVLLSGRNRGRRRFSRASANTPAADVGRNNGTPVSEDYRVPFAFNGVIDKVTVTLTDETADGAAADLVRRENRAKRALAD